MKLYQRRKEIDVPVRKVSSLGAVRGLMFRRHNTDNLLFEFSDARFASIHSFFVFFPFLAVWLDSKNNVLRMDLVKPFTFRVSPPSDVKKLVEIPFNTENRRIIDLLVGKGKI